MTRNRWAYVNGRPAHYRRERNHIARLAILYGLTVALITHAIFTVLFSPRRHQ
jgi:tetrahydromethanopterin S-methyltransferase subunit G